MATHGDVSWIKVEAVLLVGYPGRQQHNERSIEYWRGYPILEKICDGKTAEWRGKLQGRDIAKISDSLLGTERSKKF